MAPPLSAVWRLLETGARPGAWNMSCDAAVLEAVGDGEAPPTLRFFAWDPPAVSIGRHQPAPDAGARAAIAAAGATWVRRPTGGRAVWHGPPGEELTYSVVGRIGEPPLPGGLADVHRRVHEALADGLRALGIAAGVAPRARRDGTSIGPASRLACFAASVPGEIVVGERKLLGSAQRRGRGAWLQHGSLPLAGNPAILAEVWSGSLDPTRVATASAAAGRRVGFAEAARALGDALGRRLGVRFEPAGLTDAEERAISARMAATALA